MFSTLSKEYQKQVSFMKKSTEKCSVIHAPLELNKTKTSLQIGPEVSGENEFS